MLGLDDLLKQIRSLANPSDLSWLQLVDGGRHEWQSHPTGTSTYSSEASLLIVQSVSKTFQGHFA